VEDGKLITGLASHWPCVADTVVYSSKGSAVVEREMSTPRPPTAAWSSLPLPFSKGEPRVFHWRGRTEGPKAESGVWLLRMGQQPPPHQLGGVWRALYVSSPAGFRAEPRPLKGFPLFSALRMVSPDTIILLMWTIVQARPPCPLAFQITRVKSVCRTYGVDVGQFVEGQVEPAQSVRLYEQ